MKSNDICNAHEWDDREEVHLGLGLGTNFLARKQGWSDNPSKTQFYDTEFFLVCFRHCMLYALPFCFVSVTRLPAQYKVNA